MDGLISRQAAIDAFGLSEKTRKYGGDHSGYNTLMLYEIQNVLEDLPSAQPEITHCAECIHWKHSGVSKSYCDVFDWMSKAEDFCSYAERREEE